MNPPSIGLLATQVFLGTADPSRLPEACAQVRDWEGLLASLKMEGLQGIVAYQLESPGHLREERVQHVLQACLHVQAMQWLAQLVDSLGLSVIVIKGGAMLRGVYPQLGLRPLGDLDLVVRPEDLNRLCEGLRGAGCLGLPDGPHGCRAPNGVDLDLNQSPLHQLHPAFLPDMARLWDQATELPGFSPLRQLSPEHHLLVVLLHGLKHSFSRLIWLVDAALLLDRIDPADLIRLAREWHAVRALAYLRRLLWYFFRYGLPPALDREVPARLNFLESWFLAGIERRTATPALGMLVPLFCSSNWRARWRYLYGALLPAGVPLTTRLKRLARLLRDSVERARGPAYPPEDTG